MDAMSRAGLSNNDILKSGTINPALFFNQEAQFGSVRKGAAADLLLLSANPLEKIGNAQMIEGVMVRGQWLPKAYIQQRLDAIAAKYE
jgi:imidazolonepropionase-like amidohydrolase